MKKLVLARPEHDSGLRQLLRNSSMGTDIRLSLQREPSFFEAENLGSLESKVIALTDRDEKDIFGFGSMSKRLYYLNHKPVTLGYLSGLRLIPRLQNKVYLAKGFKKFKEIHDQEQFAPFYLTTIFEENENARSVLESGKAGLPTYKKLVGLHSYFLQSKRPRLLRTNLIQSLKTSEVLAVYNNQVTHGSLASRYGIGNESWLQKVVKFPVGVCDQSYSVQGLLVDLSAYKQTVVTGYGARFRLLYQSSKILEVLKLAQKLPDPGQQVRILYLIAVSSLGKTSEGFKNLLLLCREIAYEKGYHGVVLGLSENSQFCTEAQKQSISCTKSNLYTVSWQPESVPEINNSKDNIRVEVAFL